MVDLKLVKRLTPIFSLYYIDDYIILPNNKMYCNAIIGDEYCHGELLIHTITCRIDRTTSPPQKFCDVMLKCNLCGRTYVHGIPVDDETLKLMSRSKYHGKVIRFELRKIYSDLPEHVAKRLESLGYW